MARRIASRGRGKRKLWTTGAGQGGKLKMTRRRWGTRHMRSGGGATELKFLDCAWNGVTIATSTDGAGAEMQPSTGCTGAISVPLVGTSEINRDGRKYTIYSAWVNGIVATTAEIDEDDVAEMTGYWFALVLDMQTNEGTIVSENVYINPGTSSLTILPQPLRNLEKSSRYRILASQYVVPGGAYASTDGTNTASVSPQNAMTVNLSWKGRIVVECSGTAADVASVTTNAIHILAYAGSNFNTPVFVGKSRIRFKG